MLSPFDAAFSPLGMRAMRIMPEPGGFPDRPPSPTEGDALLARLAAASSALGDAVAAAGDDVAVDAVLHSAMLWEGWLDFALGRIATGERLKIGGNIMFSSPADGSRESALAQLAADRARHLDALRTRGAGLWTQAATGTDGRPLTAHALLSAIAANDDQRVALLREGR